MEPRRRFSRRHGHAAAADAEIRVRNDAPSALREALPLIAEDLGVSPNPMRHLVCRVLRTRPPPSNWSEYPNVAGEVEGLIDTCEWFEVYDIIEEMANVLSRRDHEAAEEFEAEINELFRREGIGWQLREGYLEVRVPEVFETTVSTAREELTAAGRKTAAEEIHEALRDLSRRPAPDLTGAVQHAMGALECVARDVIGDPRATLGDIVKRNPGLIPAPLDQAVSKAWGYASDQARHIREGERPGADEAELLVGVAASVATYLSRKQRTRE